MQGGGYDREWYAPLREDGTRELNLTEETIGCHVGPYAGLNVACPQTGFEYSWGRADPRSLLRHRQHGAEVVQAEDPEFSVYNDFGDPYQTPIDSSKLYQEVVLLRTPIEVVRARREQEAKKADVSVRGSVSSYTDGASALEAQYGSRDGRGATRFARRDHSLEFDEDGRSVGVWTPGSGIIRR